jgi:D-alanyl-D-alanine dipeptidase
MKTRKTILAVIAAVILFGVIPVVPSVYAAPVEQNPLELPVAGATGWMAATYTDYQWLYSEPHTSGGVLKTLQPGDGFVILEEQGAWWKVRASGVGGWVQHIGCFINLPDVLPSIIYINTNAYSSVFKSCGYEIPDITGMALYDAQSVNCRLGRTEFVMPALYSSAKKLAKAQQAALAEGNTIVLYEAFRPHSVQMSVSQNLRRLMKSNKTVSNAINSNGWNENWFIAQARSSHQRGAAFDVSLAKIVSEFATNIGSYQYTRITEYETFDMPTDIHELSPAASLRVSPNGKLKTLTDGAYLLQAYFTDSGFDSLASEWWHFTDKAGQNSADSVGILGEFVTGSTVYSTPPDGKNADRSWAIQVELTSEKSPASSHLNCVSSGF